MTTHQKERTQDNLYKAGFLILLGVCTFFIQDMHADFKYSLQRVEKLEIDISVVKSEAVNTGKQLDRVENTLTELSKQIK